jgi:hypothetical protein
MQHRTVKQLIIALIFFLILSGLGFLIYWATRSAPSCFDGIQNQEEEGIDCGGPCQSCELATLKDLEILWTKAIHVKDNFYDLGAQIKNHNQNYGSGQIPYYFRFYDSQGNLIGQRAGLTYILPRQTKYLIVTKIESSRPISRTELLFGQINWQKLQDYQPLQLVISQKRYFPLESDQPGFSQVSGVVINKTAFDFDQIDIDILLFNSEHQLVGLNTTEVKTLLSNQERHFVATWFEPIEDQIVSVEVEAETNVFDSANYMKRYGAPEQFKEY